MTDKKNTGFINTISFFSLVGIGLVLFLTELPFFNFGNVCTIIQSIANLVAYGILAYNGFKYVKSKTTAWKIVYAVALTLIIIGLLFPILNIFKA
ncbi:MAG: hypothetical protein IJW82_00185 [Clostridia bacterium]|nr:hypothetical protein [Clostridia bacterium]